MCGVSVTISSVVVSHSPGPPRLVGKSIERESEHCTVGANTNSESPGINNALSLNAIEPPLVLVSVCLSRAS